MKVKQIDGMKKNVAPSRFALFGGSFDPIHAAHLEVARCALKQAELDQVIFIPAAQSPLKLNKPLTVDAARVQMLRLALKEEISFELNTWEIEQGGVNYTIDTVFHFQRHCKDAEVFLILGGDQFEQLNRWHRIHELVRNVTFLVYPRPGTNHLPSSSIANISFQTIEAPLMETSSTLIRERCKEGLSLKGLVPQTVEAFIYAHDLYK